MEEPKSKDKDANKYGALFIPAGILLGMGVGFATGQLVAGLFIGLGVGFVIFATISVIRK